jgi:hypothetical protein
MGDRDIGNLFDLLGRHWGIPFRKVEQGSGAFSWRDAGAGTRERPLLPPQC